MELPQQVGGGVVREAHASRSEILVEHGGAQKVRHLLLLDDVARCSNDVTAAEKHGAGDAALELLQESELALFEREQHLAAAELDAIGGVDFVERGGVNAQSAPLVVRLARGVRRPPHPPAE